MSTGRLPAQDLAAYFARIGYAGLSGGPSPMPPDTRMC